MSPIFSRTAPALLALLASLAFPAAAHAAGGGRSSTPNSSAGHDTTAYDYRNQNPSQNPAAAADPGQQGNPPADTPGSSMSDRNGDGRTDVKGSAGEAGRAIPTGSNGTGGAAATH